MTQTATRESHASSSDEDDCGTDVDGVVVVDDDDDVDAWAAGARVDEGGVREGWETPVR